MPMLNPYNMLINVIKRKIWNLNSPRIIYGFKRYDGIYLEKTRVSNTTFIENKEKLNIENNVFIGHYNFIDASNIINIGEGCQITNYISIITHSSHISIRLYGKKYQDFSELKGYQKGMVSIGKYTFVGPHSTIMPNTKIGKGSIISAYSYVDGDFQDFSIISGNPAKVIGDTRNIDRKYLETYPELKEYYEEWIK
jgi:acetyltransferase-like isoleucine patch superfamily enzyme